MKLRSAFAVCALALASAAMAQTEPAAMAPGAEGGMPPSPGTSAATAAPTPEPTPDPAVVAAIDAGTTVVLARVNGKELTVREFNIALEAILHNQIGRMMEAGQPINAESAKFIQRGLKGRMLENMINKTVYQESLEPFADKVTEPEIDAEYERFEAAVAAQGKKLDELLQQNNTTKEELRGQMRDQIAKTMLVKSKGIAVEADPAEVQKVFEQQSVRVNLSHILIRREDDPNQPMPPAPAADGKDALKGRALADSLLKRIRAGESFETLADQYSQDPKKAAGGEIGFITRGMVQDEAFETAAFGLKKDEISDVVESQFGFHIIKLKEREELAGEKAGTLKDRIASAMSEQKVQDAIPELVEELRKTAKIEYVTPVASVPDVKIDLPEGVGAGAPMGQMGPMAPPTGVMPPSTDGGAAPPATQPPAEAAPAPAQ